MNSGIAAAVVIVLAALAANLPFFNERLLGVVRLGAFARKPFWLRLLELLVLYFAVGLIAWLLEERLGNAATQRWEFYVITGCLFIVLAFPGFVYRYLVRHH